MIRPTARRRRRSAAIFVVISLAVACSFGPIGRAWGQRPKGKKYALLVGVDRYGKGTLLPGLTYPQRDVEGLSDVLLDSGYDKDDVVVMTRKSGVEDFDLLPTADHVRNQLTLLLKLLKPGDTILILLCGHGVMLDAPAPEGEVPTSKSFFCPMDADLRVKDLAKLIAFDEFFEALSRSKATTKLLLVDACRNELKAAPEARAPGISMPPPPAPPPSVAALYACSEKEVSWEDSALGGGHGVFSHFVIEGLKGAADKENGNGNNETTLSELTDYVQDNVIKFVRKRHAVSQEPRLLGNVGQILLRVGRPVGRVLIRSDGVEPGEERDDNLLSMKFCWCPNGNFRMGSPFTEPERHDDEGPVQVSIRNGFWMGKYEVTQSDWQKIVGRSLEDQRKLSNGRPVSEGPRLPICYVNQADASGFCRALTAVERQEGRLPAGWAYRLPTEVEWEYACRSGADAATSFGDGLSGLDANFDGNKPYNGGRFGPYVRGFTPVGNYRPNAWGLHDMHGNVWEWCLDYFEVDIQGGVDPVGRLDGPVRAIRGGGWYDSGKACRAAYRGNTSPESRFPHLGFRVIMARLKN